MRAPALGRNRPLGGGDIEMGRGVSGAGSVANCQEVGARSHQRSTNPPAKGPAAQGVRGVMDGNIRYTTLQPGQVPDAPPPRSHLTAPLRHVLVLLPFMAQKAHDCSCHTIGSK